MKKITTPQSKTALTIDTVLNKTPIRLIVIAASPRNESCNYIAQELLKEAEKEAKKYLQPLEGEILKLSKTNFEMCDRCDFCLDPEWRTKSKRYCKIEDDLENWYPKIEKSDGIILISPVYINSVSGLCVSFTDRLRPILKTIRNGKKCGQVIAVGGSRYGGQINIVKDLKELLAGTWIVPIPSLPEPSRITVWSGYKSKTDEHKYGSGWEGARDDIKGMQGVKELGKQIIKGIRLIKAGTTLSKDE
ncbi:MAG: flavodoxin family protein [Candidatus Ranarchaeia archaeon]